MQDTVVSISGECPSSPHTLPLHYPYDPHTDHISWAKFFSLFNENILTLKIIFLLSFVRKWKVCNNVFSFLP